MAAYVIHVDDVKMLQRFLKIFPAALLSKLRFLTVTKEKSDLFHLLSSRTVFQLTFYTLYPQNNISISP